MSRSKDETLKAREEPTVLLVVSSQEFEGRCQSAVEGAGAAVRTSTVAKVATAAARWRPLVIVVPQPVYDFDPREFDDLARDVCGVVLQVDTELISQKDLRKQLRAALAVAMRARE